jgi:hypothetical protein
MKKFTSLAIFSTVLSIVAILIAWVRCEPITADWMSILVSVLAILVTTLIGWNIRNIIDLKQKEAQIEGEINYIHNKADYNHAITYSFLASIAVGPQSELEGVRKMLVYGLNAVKIFTNLGIEKECTATIDILCLQLENSNVKFDKSLIAELNALIGGIPDYTSVEGMLQLQNMINSKI